jgi:hypothetical protein
VHAVESPRQRSKPFQSSACVSNQGFVRLTKMRRQCAASLRQLRTSCCIRPRQLCATTGNPSVPVQSQVNSAALLGANGCEHYDTNPRFQAGGSESTLICLRIGLLSLA